MPGIFRYIIIDDEKGAQSSLQGLINTHFKQELECVGTASSVPEGVYLILNHLPDLVFLDMEVSSENGLSLFNHFEERSFEVIIISGHKKYGVDAVKSPALDYLLKPVNPSELETALRRLKHIRDERKDLKAATELITRLNLSYPEERMIAFPTQSGYTMQPRQLIMYCEADQNYTKIHLLSSSTILVSKPIGTVEEMIHDKNFFRIHKSFLINMKFLKNYNKHQIKQITLVNGTQLPLAARRTAEFIKHLQDS